MCSENTQAQTHTQVRQTHKHTHSFVQEIVVAPLLCARSLLVLGSQQRVKQTKPLWGKEAKGKMCKPCRVLVGGKCCERAKRAESGVGGCVAGGCNFTWGDREGFGGDSYLQPRSSLTHRSIQGHTSPEQSHIPRCSFLHSLLHSSNGCFLSTYYTPGSRNKTKMSVIGDFWCCGEDR